MNADSQTAVTEIKSFTVDDPTLLSDVVTATAQNTILTISGEVSYLGVGDSTVTLLLGATADALSPVETVTITQVGAFSFAPQQLNVGTYYYAIRADNPYQSIPWSDQTEPASIEIADASEYMRKGGIGNWNDSNMWQSNDSGNFGVPSASSTVVIKPEVDSVIQISVTVKVANLLFSTAKASITFKGGAITSDADFYMENAANAKDLIIDGSKFKDKTIRDLDKAGNILILNQGYAKIGNSQSFTTLTLSNKGTYIDAWQGATITADELVAGISFSKFRVPKATFGSFKPIHEHLSVVGVKDNTVTFTDTKNILKIGGTATLTDATSQIPVTPQFAHNMNSTADQNLLNTGYPEYRYLPFGLCTIDETGSIREIPTSTMLTSFDNATALDNVHLPSDVTLNGDVSVNAIVTDKTIDLNGHKPTVMSGVLRQASGTSGNQPKVKNGTLILPVPSMMMGALNNNNPQCTDVQILSGDNKDPLRPMFDSFAQSETPFKVSTESLTNFIGMVRLPSEKSSFDSNTSISNVVFDRTYGNMSSFASLGHAARTIFRGLGGMGTVYSGGMGSAIRLGDPTDEFDSLGGKTFVVAKNGYLLPGSVDHTGFRRGTMLFGSAQHDNRGYTNLIFKPKSTASFTVFPNGDCTKIETEPATTEKKNHHFHHH